jgi:hypothetical protein
MKLIYFSVSMKYQIYISFIIYAFDNHGKRIDILIIKIITYSKQRMRISRINKYSRHYFNILPISIKMEK